MRLAQYWSQGLQARSSLDKLKNRQAFDRSMRELGLGPKEGETYAEWKHRLSELFVEALRRANDEARLG